MILLHVLRCQETWVPIHIPHTFKVLKKTNVCCQHIVAIEKKLEKKENATSRMGNLTTTDSCGLKHSPKIC